MKKIQSFIGEYSFLSNFAPITVTWPSSSNSILQWPTAEHAFQASKTLNHEDKLEIYKCDTPGRAKRIGRQVELRLDWEDKKISIMRGIIISKFVGSHIAMFDLLNTGNAELIEENHWGDCFWGVCNGKGRNELGKILMEVRGMFQ